MISFKHIIVASLLLAGVTVDMHAAKAPKKSDAAHKRSFLSGVVAYWHKIRAPKVALPIHHATLTIVNNANCNVYNSFLKCTKTPGSYKPFGDYLNGLGSITALGSAIINQPFEDEYELQFTYNLNFPTHIQVDGSRNATVTIERSGFLSVQYQ